MNRKYYILCFLVNTDTEEEEMIRERIYEKILLWNGHCDIIDVIPSPPVYYTPGNCTKNEQFPLWNNSKYDYHFFL